MKQYLLPSLKLTLICIVFFSGVYTVLIWGFAQVVPGKGEGETKVVNGKKYYLNIGQAFTNDEWFQGRPSAVDYNAAGSCGSNKGPSNPDYLKLVQERIDTFMVHNPTVKRNEIPADLVTASGSGLDPHISPKAARVQADRISKQRNISKEKVLTLIDQHTEKPYLGILGTERVNVLKLNLALAEIK
jgi:K+-transporting ATPase ATPase C chain